MAVNNLIQVVYFSERVEGPEVGTAEDICDRIEREHTRLGFTGFVFALGGCFVSVLEGEHDDVLARMEQLAADPGHQRMVVLREGSIGARKFASWRSSSLEQGEIEDRDRSGAQAFAARLSKRLRMAEAQPA